MTRVFWLLLAFAGAQTAHADALAMVQILREGGCGGTLPYAHPLRHEPALDRAAREWSSGQSLAQAIEHSGYSAEATSALQLKGSDAAVIDTLRSSNCATLAKQELRDVGAFSRGTESWLVMGSPYIVPTSAQAPMLVTRTLELVNQARARGAHCGERAYAPAPPVTLSGTLAGVALGHASDMAEHDYFEHEDLSGHTPADRVHAVGYRDKLVGENIAYGPRSAEEVVQGWLDSPGHCQNIMDPRFAEMGIAYAPGRNSKRGLYWVQVLATPRA